jgi:alkylhydroperoxidase/carboxymuconolactone decarboxylase family protein YurZ
MPQLSDELRECGPWDDALAALQQWDPLWTAACEKMSTNPWANGVLPRKFVELVGVALNAARTNLNPDGTRRHIRAALDAGATRDEILMILKMASVMSIHSCSLGAPILLEEAKAAGASPSKKQAVSTPACDKMKAAGQWNTAWDPFLELDPVWTDEFMATGIGIYGSNVFTPKETKLLSVAFDASYTHMYAPGTRRHIRSALKAGATIEEIMEVLKLANHRRALSRYHEFAYERAPSNSGAPLDRRRTRPAMIRTSRGRSKPALRVYALPQRRSDIARPMRLLGYALLVTFGVLIADAHRPVTAVEARTNRMTVEYVPRPIQPIRRSMRGSWSVACLKSCKKYSAHFDCRWN